MPTSDLQNIGPILTVIGNLSPKSILDVGCGFGKYGLLAREYLDVWNERYRPDSWAVRIEGIEAFGDYRNPVWDYVYNQIYVGDALNLLPTLGGYDVILVADVIEHLEKDQACQLARDCLERCSVLIISTPKEFFAQTDLNNNSYEVHRCLWTAADFPVATHVTTIPCLSCNIYLASRNPIAPTATYPADVRDVLYLRSRHKLRRLGPIGLVASLILRELNRWLT
jgi:SAM-dependent methyltransferase